MAKKSKSTVNKAGNYTKPGMRKKIFNHSNILKGEYLSVEEYLEIENEVTRKWTELVKRNAKPMKLRVKEKQYDVQQDIATRKYSKEEKNKLIERWDNHEKLLDEWEKAGRGKRPVKYPWGDSPPDSEKLNFNEEKRKTIAVGSYEKGKSDYGIYDLSGNASEWVQDWHFPEYYLFSPKENPKGPKKGQYKIIRGGNWRNTAEYVDLTYRNATTPRMRNTGIGFRCAKSAP